MGKKRNKRRFLREFFKDSKQVGSVAPSSRMLQRRMVSKVDFAEAKCIVELGAGEGCITREIIRRMGKDTVLLCFELHQGFVDNYLQFDDPRVHVINDSAEHIGKYLEKYGLENADYIISSLPLTNFSKDLKESIIDEAIRVMGPGAIYMQYQYSITALKLLKSKFQKVKTGFTPINIPPAFVYTCYA